MSASLRTTYRTPIDRRSGKRRPDIRVGAIQRRSGTAQQVLQHRIVAGVAIDDGMTVKERVELIRQGDRDRVVDGNGQLEHAARLSALEPRVDPLPVGLTRIKSFHA